MNVAYSPTSSRNNQYPSGGMYIHQADRANWQTACSVEKSHGRLERRTLLSSPDLNGLFFREWGEIGQVFRIERERTIKVTKKGTCYEHAK